MSFNCLLQTMAVEEPKWVRCRCRYSKLLRMNGVFVRHRMALSTKYCEVFSIKLCITLQWHHNGRDGVSNHQPHHCVLNRLVRRISKKTSKLRVTGPCEGNQPVTSEFPAQRTSNAVNVSIWWMTSSWYCSVLFCFGMLPALSGFMWLAYPYLSVNITGTMHTLLYLLPLCRQLIVVSYLANLVLFFKVVNLMGMGNIFGTSANF